MVKTSLYYFPNDLFREKGIVITVKDLEEIARKNNTRITSKLDKIGSIGLFSRFLLSGIQPDILIITIEGENEENVKSSIKDIYTKYGPYEVFRGPASSIARKLKSELK
ncbi:MAG: hypothetical protein N3D72_01320 [Candidatus Methanomethyliaceae archaeon]|nr:hypothetical protein [Candidatus Methanomethyliaceae archaeon]